MAGRPKRVFTDDDVALIEQYARNNCHNKTISTALNIPNNSLIRHFGKKIQLWKAQGRVELRQYQRDLAKSNPAMAIFLGKNVLGQVDKQIVETEAAEQVKLTEAIAEDARKLANILNLEDARKGKVG